LLFVTVIYLSFFTLHAKKPLVNNFFQLFLQRSVACCLIYSMSCEQCQELFSLFLERPVFVP